MGNALDAVLAQYEKNTQSHRWRKQYVSRRQTEEDTSQRIFLKEPNQDKRVSYPSNT